MKTVRLILFTALVSFGVAAAAEAQEIFEAIRSGEMGKVKELVEKDPQLVQARNARQSTPLHMAVDLDQKLIVVYLLEKGVAYTSPNSREGICQAADVGKLEGDGSLFTLHRS